MSTSDATWVLVAVVGFCLTAWALAPKCDQLHRDGVGEVHRHVWPRVRPLRVRYWFRPEGRERYHEVPTGTVEGLAKAETVEQAMAAIRRPEG